MIYWTRDQSLKTTHIYIKNFKEAIQKSQKILITSHINCDQDGITSALGTKLIIEKNFEGKIVEANIDSALQQNISFLKDFHKIQTKNLVEKIEEFKPDLLIFTDGQVAKRFCEDEDRLLKTIKDRNITSALIDHHDSETTLQTDFRFNNWRSSCAEEIYHLFVKGMNLEIDRDIAEIILTGMVYDTGIFTYKNKYFRETANTIADLLEYGVIIEDIINSKKQYTKMDLKIIGELSNNLEVKDNFCYTYISDEFFNNEILDKKIPEDEFKRGRHIWMDLFIKNIKDCSWGFVIYQTYTKNKYKIAARSRQDKIAARNFAENFGGGGHDQAAGFSLEAENIQEALEKILEKKLKLKI